MKTSKLATAAMACIGAGALLLTGCTGSASTDTTSPFRGFENVGELETGQTVWYDKGSESGMSNVIIAEDYLRVLSCLGEPTLICNNNKRAEGQLMAIIAEEGTERLVVTYAGEEVELQRMATPEHTDEPALVFAGKMPPFTGDNFSWSFKGYNADGEEVWSK